MQIEKKLIACSILAIAIGIATVVPLSFFMTPATASAQTIDEPWFNLNINYATCQATMVFSHLSAMYTYAYNYSINTDAVDTQVGARIEYFRIQFYSDQGQLANETVAIAVNCSEYYDPESIQFAREDWFNTTDIFFSSLSFVSNFDGTLSDNGGGATAFSVSEDDELSEGIGSTEQIENIQNAQTIYLDVHRVGYITCNGNATIVTLADDAVIQHLELTKSGDHFVYGIRPLGYKLDENP